MKKVIIVNEKAKITRVYGAVENVVETDNVATLVFPNHYVDIPVGENAFKVFVFEQDANLKELMPCLPLGIE